MIELSSSAKTSTSQSILNWTMLAWKPTYPTTVQRYASTYITKNNGLLGQYADNKTHQKMFKQKITRRCQWQWSYNICPHVSYLSK